MHMKTSTMASPDQIDTHFNWHQVARWVLTSRAMDALEETELYPKKKINYQFSARGHAPSQVLLGSLVTHKHDAAGAYYRYRPLLLTLGLTIEESFAASLAKVGGFSDGRDIGAVCNMPSQGRATVLPMAGEVGSRFTPNARWAPAGGFPPDTLQGAAFRKPTPL